jgi:hypothetical protein
VKGTDWNRRRGLMPPRHLDQAPEQGWVVVDMKRDWKTILPPSGTEP